MTRFDALRAWFRAAPDPPAFTQGMTLQPGESATLDLELPPEMSAAITEFHRAGRTIKYDDGPIVHKGHGRFAREIRVMVDGKRYAGFELSWTEKP